MRSPIIGVTTIYYSIHFFYFSFSFSFLFLISSYLQFICDTLLTYLYLTSRLCLTQTHPRSHIRSRTTPNGMAAITYYFPSYVHATLIVSHLSPSCLDPLTFPIRIPYCYLSSFIISCMFIIYLGPRARSYT